MLDRRLVAGGAGLALVVAVMLGLGLGLPRLAAARLAGLAEQQLGRGVSIGGASLGLSPLAVHLSDAVLAGPLADDDSLVIARSATIPVSLGQLFGAAPRVDSLSLSGAEIALLINERGEASWDFAGHDLHGPLSVTLEQAHLRYFDIRNSQSMTLGQVDGRLDFTPEGGLAFAGTAVINNRLVRIDADLKSLARVNADGSPLELALSADDGAANFSGRLSTAKVLSLAGPVNLTSATPAGGLRLAGLPVPDQAAMAGPLTIDGALDSAGRAFAIRNASLALGAFRAVGELGADLRNDRPRLQANLAADRLWLDLLLPAAGARNGDWGRNPLPFALLKGLDIEAALETRSLGYGGFSAGPSSLKLTLTDGKLQLDDASRLADNGTLTFTVKADAGAVPPSAGLDIAVTDAPAQPLIGALTGATGLGGNGSFSASLTAAGTTQEEMVGTLKGNVSVDLANGAITGVDLAGLMLAAKHKILEGWQAAPGSTAFTRLAGEARIEDGIASFRGFSIEGADASFTLEGLVDVLRQAIAISASASGHGQPLLPVPVIAKGLWAGPKIYPDLPNILSDPEGGFAKLQDGN